MRIAAVVAVVVLAYGAGVVSGVLGDNDDGSTQSASGQPAPASSADVVAQAEKAIQDDAAKPISESELDKAAVEGMLQALDDKWSSYYNPSDFASFQDVIDGEYTGVGLWVHRNAAGAVSVTSVQPGSPADVAGLKSGDVVSAVAGKPVGSRSIADVVTALRGNAGTSVRLTYVRGAGSTTVTMKRTAVATGDVSDTVVGSVMVIKISAFSKGVGSQVKKLDEQARSKHLTGIVLDLRGDPGGLLDEAVQTASAFLNGGLVVSFDARGSAPVHMYAPNGGDTGTPLAVLVDGSTASAAEVVTGALQDRNRAVIVGSRTFGKGSVQQPQQLTDGSAIEFTVGTYITPDGRSLDGVGIEPDVVVAPGTSASGAQAQAVDVLSGLLADAGTGGHG
jgi:carboxyl-terminal processing protease